jgi:hypothetical protein
MSGQEFEASKEQFNTTRKQDPAKAVADLRQFLQERAADLAPNQTRFLYQMLALAQWSSLHDSKAALATLDEALQKLPPAFPERVYLHDAKAKVLLGAGKLEDAQTEIEAEWQKAVEGGQPFALLNTYIEVLNRRGKGEQALKILQEMAVGQMDAVSADSPPLHLKLLLDQLVKMNQAAAAESWAKLYFMLASYNERSLTEATQWLVKAWTAKYGTPAKAAELVAALQNPEAPSPLREIKLPALDAAVLQQRLDTARREPQRVVLLLALGRDRDAMLTARALMLDKPQTSDGILEVCRVFKAHDLGLKRANAFLEYCKTGQGQDPTVAFLKETDAK